MTTGQTTAAKTVQQANRHANCFTKAQGMEAEGYRAVKVCQDRYDIFKPGNFVMADYTVYLYDNTCDCADWQKHKDGVCKHTLFAQMAKAGEEAELAGLEEQCRLYDDAEGFLDRIPTPTLMQLAVKDLMAAMATDLAKVKDAIQRQDKRRTNYIQQRQEADKENRLENALMMIGRYQQLPEPSAVSSAPCEVCGIANIYGKPACFGADCPRRIVR